jgi:TolB-like protein
VQPNGDLLGHGVNVAARLMARSDPGSALVSADVRRTIRGPLAERLVSRGSLQLDKMAETIEAFALLAGVPLAVAAPAKQSEPLLAVLPFDNLSDDRELQFFSDGVSEEIIQRLSRGAGLKVIGRTSSFQFRGPDKAARKVASELKCSHILDGSIRRAGARVRTTAHLVEAASQTTLWSDRYDGSLDDVFAVQDEISEQIATALHQTFTSFSTKAIDPAVYDLYLRASPKSYAPDELRTNLGLLEVATQRAPNFAEAWGRLAFVRSWLRVYQPFGDRAASADLVRREAERALALDPQNADALVARYFVVAPFGRFVEADAIIDRIRLLSGSSDALMYVGWHSRAIGRVRDGAEETQRAYRLDALNPMLANLTALAIMSTGRVQDSVPLLEELMVRVPDMSFPVANVMRAYAFLNDWTAIDRLLDPSMKRPLREFQDGLAFIRTKRYPTPENIGSMRSALEDHFNKTGCIDVSRLVYAAHLGLVEDAYRTVERACLGPKGTGSDMMGPDGYRTGLLFWDGMPEIRKDPRFVTLCARLGLVEFWLATGKWPDCVDQVPYDFKAECEKARHVAADPFGF